MLEEGNLERELRKEGQKSMHSISEMEKAEFNSLVAQLIDVLYQHNNHHLNLIDILKSKKEAMVELKHDELEKILNLERESIGAIGVVEEERIGLTQELARYLGRPRGTLLKLVELVQYVDDAYQEELLNLRDSIRNIADELDRLNQLNRTLAFESLEHVNLYISMLAGKDPEAKLYTPFGSKTEDTPSLVLDRKI